MSQVGTSVSICPSPASGSLAPASKRQGLIESAQAFAISVLADELSIHSCKPGIRARSTATVNKLEPTSGGNQRSFLRQHSDPAHSTSYTRQKPPDCRELDEHVRQFAVQPSGGVEKRLSSNLPLSRGPPSMLTPSWWPFPENYARPWVLMRRGSGNRCICRIVLIVDGYG